MSVKIRKGNYRLGEIEIEEPEVVFQNSYGTVYNDRVIFPSGKHGTYLRFAGVSFRSVAVLPIAPDGQFLLIKTFRHGARGWGYEIPKGSVDDDETLESAALRELKEETGLKADTLVAMGEYSDSPAIVQGKISCFCALDCRLEQTAQPEWSEAIQGVQAFSMEEVLEGRASLDFSDALTELLIFRYNCQIKRLRR